jgi:hypothetical protein
LYKTNGEASCVVERFRLRQALTPDQVTDVFAQIEADLLKENQPAATEVAARPVTDGGKRLIVIDYSRPDRNPSGDKPVPERVRQYSYPVERNLFRVTCGASNGQFAKYEGIFTAIIKSLVPEGTRPSPVDSSRGQPTIDLRVGDYDPASFNRDLKRAIAFTRPDLMGRFPETSDSRQGLTIFERLAAQSILVRRTRTLVDAERTAHTQMFLARARAYGWNSPDARTNDSLRQVLRVDPFLSGPFSATEKFRLAEILAREGGILEISSSLPDAILLVDGAPAGISATTPTQVRLLPGEVEVRARRVGFSDGVSRATVQAGRVVSVAVTLR